MKIQEGMKWPPMGLLEWKMAEHSAWYSGDAEVLANFYTLYYDRNVFHVPYPIKGDDTFWGRQIVNQGETMLHVPIASDIATTSADFLFAESPMVKVAEAHEKTASSMFKETQKELDIMLLESGFYNKILEAAEACAALGGIFIKIAWDNELSKYPIPVIVQADRAIPEFSFGILTTVTFWKVIDASDSGDKVYRLLERYERGSISYTLYQGTSDKLGKEVPLAAHTDTANMDQVIKTPDMLLAAYIPNILPNRLDRNSFLGRSDYSGIEGLMDSLDEVYSSWMKDIVLARARIMLPESYLDKTTGHSKFNVDKSLYVKLDIDPTTINSGNTITCQQFDIRSEQFEKTALNLLERIITTAGYSPQSFGLNIQGRAESGTALSMRERKSFATKGKKQNYWQAALKKVVLMMATVYKEELGGAIEADFTPNIAFSDAITNNLNELSTSVKMISDAMAASTKTKVAMFHPDWEEEQIDEEVAAIIDENGLGPVPPPDLNNLDLSQMMQFKDNKQQQKQQ